MSLYKFKIYCETDARWEDAFVNSPPTQCPVNIAHSVNLDSVHLESTSIKENKAFADELMQALKLKNLQEGLSSINQSAWVHHRLRKINYTLSNNITIVQIDLMNLIISGDVETAEFVLGQLLPDDMTEAYHWLTQARIDWIRNEIRTYLGWSQL